LPTHTISSEIFKVLSGFIEERGLEWKNCFGVCTDGSACLTGRNSGLVTKIKDLAGNNLLLMHCYIHRQNLASKKKMAPEFNVVLSQSVKILLLFFYWRYNPLWVLAFSVIFFHSILSLLSFLHPLIPIAWKSSSTSSIHLFLGLPLILLPVGFHSNILLGILPSSIRITCPTQIILLLLMHLTMSALLISSSSSWFLLLLQVPFSSFIGPHIFLKIFRSNILNCCSFLLVLRINFTVHL